MNTCATCKHWQPNIAGKPQRPIGACYAPKMQSSTLAIMDDPTAAGLDDCWSAVNAPPIVLLTGPKFGCIHHEQIG